MVASLQSFYLLASCQTSKVKHFGLIREGMADFEFSVGVQVVCASNSTFRWLSLLPIILSIFHRPFSVLIVRLNVIFYVGGGVLI